MCNKCDVEYRTSKNKRLLIELTLLKMSTIGQFNSEKKNNSPIKITPKNIQKEIIKEKVMMLLEKIHIIKKKLLKMIQRKRLLLKEKLDLVPFH